MVALMIKPLKSQKWEKYLTENKETVDLAVLKHNISVAGGDLLLNEDDCNAQFCYFLKLKMHMTHLQES